LETRLLRKLELTYTSDAASTATLETDLPGGALALRQTIAVPAAQASTAVTREFILGPNLRGRLVRVTLSPAGQLRLHSARLWNKILGGQASEWHWVPLPVVDTPDAWGAMRLPITPTPDEWSMMRLPIDPTPDGWQAMRLPIDPTPDGWQTLKLPVPPTAQQPRWSEIPVDEP
jgi:hypothetical protein